ncbi:hypothetical protein DICSQDRAFT_58862 [Dichomitus squalens LYAD-421 SS1]|uniref:DUF6534 domain-containing protein n=1 Tax=Dichomitus squalens (strain LYAD-421) TaxID=732165 RepID=R7T312_DICSQ|nr:uncharacterized protein DICSQDRAFT_58862 [Dichomitus squalens LYAD-421 SS1]EJF62402.1 hypothetical protein DICSQDRAFT_58862 [Dichomitus squalens LYAD-421 SS1]
MAIAGNVADFTQWEALYTTGKPDAAMIGPALIQGFLQYLFQGAQWKRFSRQAIKFYDRCQGDPMTLRVYVFLLVFFSIVQTVFESYIVWLVTIDIYPILPTEPLWNAVICTLCESYLIRRCYKVTGRNIAVLLILSALSATSFVAVLILVSIRDRGTYSDGPAYTQLLHASTYAYPLWVYSQLVTAISLTSILSVSLWRTRTGLPHLDRTVACIIFLTWETAALPSICMLVSGIIFSIRDAQGPGKSVVERSHLDLFFAILTGKLYALGLLRMINSRTKFRERLNSNSLGRRTLSGWQRADDTANSAESRDMNAGRGEMSTLRDSVAESRKDFGSTSSAVQMAECGAGLPTSTATNPVVTFQPPEEGGRQWAVGSGSGIEVHMIMQYWPIKY